MRDFVEESIETSITVARVGRTEFESTNEANVENITVLDVMNATSNDTVAQLVKIWENKNAQRALRGAGLSTMALSLAACGSDSNDAAVEEPVVEEPVVPVGQAFSLTILNDEIDGGDGDDTITGVMVDGDADGVADQQTAGFFDIIDGGDGDDTLSIVIDTGVDLTVSNVETMVVRALGAVTMEFDAVSGLENLTIRDQLAGDDVTTSDIQASVVLTLDATAGDNTLDYDDDAIGSDAFTQVVNAVGAVSGDLDLVSGGDDAITGLALSVTEDVTMSLTQTGNTDTLETITVSGTGDVTLTEGATSFDSITAVDASGLAGGLTINLGAAAAAVTFTGGSGDDDVTASGANDTISTGAGDDTITMAAGNLTIDAGAGDDTVEMTGLTAADSIDGGAGTNTASLVADDLDDLEAFLIAGSIENFSVAAVTGALAADLTFDALATGIDTVDLTVSAGAGTGEDLTIDNFSGGTVQFGLDQTDVVTVLSVGAADSITLVMDEGAGATHASVVVEDIETVTIITDSAADDVIFTALQLDGVEALVISGAGDLDISAATADALATVDLSAATGDIVIDMEASDGVEITVGNLGDTSVITLGAANGVVDTLVFTGELDNGITIEEFETGLGGDVLDLSAFGVTALADLTFTDTGADVTVEIDGFDGVITLDSVAAIADLNAANFIFA